MKKIILGGGISAKIFSFYNPEYIMIYPEGQAQVDCREFCYSMYLPKVSVCDSFLEELGLSSVETERIPIAYYYKGKIHYGRPEGEIKELLLRKKLYGLERPVSLFGTEAGVAEPFLDDKRDSMIVYRINFSDLLESINRCLANRTRINAKAVEIDRKKIKLDNDRELEYSHLVSTIPAPIFWNIYSKKEREKKFYSASLYVGSVKRNVWESMDYPNLPDTIMCYFPESKFVFDRARTSVNILGDIVAVESPKPFQGATELPAARIVRSYNNIAPPKVMFLGRYAQWNPDVLISHVIAYSSQKYLLEKVWANQKFFNQRFVNYSPDIVYVQERVKDYILHMISETDSLLNTINWKLQDSDKRLNPVNREAVLEEWIDIFKFWLSIGLMFGFTPSDFEKAYWEKSLKLEEKFK